MSTAFDLLPFQVVLTVSDLTRSIEFYGQFGFEAGPLIQKDDGRCRVTLRARSSPGFEIKLFTNPHAMPNLEPPRLESYLAQVGTRYMSLRCQDVDGFYQAFKDSIRFVRPPKNGMTGCRYAFFLDPDGILVEVYQTNYGASVRDER